MLVSQSEVANQRALSSLHIILKFYYYDNTQCSIQKVSLLCLEGITSMPHYAHSKCYSI